MANKIINDRGEEVFAIGMEGSYARIGVQYPATIRAVFDKMVFLYQSYDGIMRHLQYAELEYICHDMGVTDPKTIGTIYNIAGERFEAWKRLILINL